MMAQHLGDGVTQPSIFRTPGDLDRLITGLNLLTAELAQTMQRLAYHVDRNDLPCLDNVTSELTADVIDSLARAGSNGELVAGHLKDAQLTLWPLTSQPTTA